MLEANAERIRLELTCAADPKLYDLPLTLVTRTPPGWRTLTVTQGERSTAATAAEGTVRYRAQPNAGPITLTPAEPPGAK